MHSDNWAQKAKQMGYRSRAVFKLEEILQKIRIKDILNILDLGSAPGGWSQLTKKKYPKSGPFWTNSLNYHDMNKIILRIFNLKNLKWKKISKKYSHEILNYDPNNSIAKKTIREILKK